MRFIYFSDAHYKGVNPQSRTDDYQKAILSKLQYLVTYAISHNIDMVLCGGDLLDTAIISDGVKNDLILILKQLYDKNIPLFTCIGSHDYLDYNLKSLDRTSIKVLHNSGLLTIIDNKVTFNGYDIFATHHTPFLEDNSHNFEIEKDKKFSIQLVHGMVVDKPVHFRHILLDDLPLDNMGDLVFCGHYHPGFADYKDRVFNPGSLGRKEKTERSIGFFVCECNDGGVPFIKFEVIPCEKDVFKDTATVHSDEERIEKIQEYLDSLEVSTEITVNSDPVLVIGDISRNMGKSEKVTEFVINKVTEKLSGGSYVS